MVVIRKGYEPVFQRCGSEQVIEGAVREYLDAIGAVAQGKAIDSAVEAKGRELYNRLIAQVIPHIDGIDVLIISPDSVLNFVPFPSLLDPKGEFLAEKFLIYHVASGRDLVPRNGAGLPSETAVVFGDPFFSFAGSAANSNGVTNSNTALSSWKGSVIMPIDLPPLPGTQAEALRVGATLRSAFKNSGAVRINLGNEATEAASGVSDLLRFWTWQPTVSFGFDKQNCCESHVWRCNRPKRGRNDLGRAAPRASSGARK